MHRHLSKILLGAILLFAFAISMFHLDARSLWLDEGVTFYNSGASSLAAVTQRVASLDLSPPGYYYLMHFWSGVAGSSTMMFRLLSVIFYLGSLILVYLIPKFLFKKESIGLISAFLLAINPFFIGFSEEARMYMMLSFLILLALYSMLKFIMGNQDKRWLIIFTLTNILGLYTHNFYVFSLTSLGLVYLFLIACHKNFWPSFFYGLISLSLTILAYLPWISSLSVQLQVERYWIAPISKGEVKSYFLDFAGGSVLTLGLFVLFCLLGLVYLFNTRKSDKRRVMIGYSSLVLFSLLAISIPVLYSFLISPLAKVRYFLFAPAIISIAAALGIYSLKRVHSILLTLPLVLFVAMMQPWQTSTYPIEMNEDFRSVVQYIQEKDSTTANVIVHTPSASHVLSFYGKSLKLSQFPNTFDLREYNISENDASNFAKQVQHMDQFWLLITHSHENPQGILRKWSEAKCPQVEEKDFGPIFLAHYKCT